MKDAFVILCSLLFVEKMPKRVDLNLTEKVKIIELRENNVSLNKILDEFKCGKSVVYKIMKDKDKILNLWMAGNNGNRKRKLRITGNEQINEAVWEWFVSARAKNVPLSGPLLQAEALRVAAKLQISTFKASSGWLDSFKTRHLDVYALCTVEFSRIDKFS